LIIGGILSVSVTALLVRTLLPAEFGNYALITLIPPMALNLCGFGLASSAVYFASRGAERSDSIASGILSVNLGLGFLVAVAAGLIVIVGEFGNDDSLSQSSLLYSILLIPVFFFNSTLTAILQGLQDFRASSIAALIPNASLLVLIGVVGSLTSINLTDAVGLYAMSHLLALIAVSRMRPEGFLGLSSTLTFIKSFGRERIRYALSVYVGNLLAFINTRAVAFVVGYYSSTESVALFVALMALYEVLLFGATSVATVVLPIAARHESTATDNTGTTCTVTKIASILTFLAALLLCLCGSWVLTNLYGEFYRGGSNALWLFGAAAFSATYLRILAAEVAGRGYPQLNTYIAFVGSVVGLIGIAALSSVFDIYGAAAGFAVSVTVQAVLTGHVFCRISGSRMSTLIKLDHHEMRMFRSWVRRFRRT
jgi:O-antigen/teichoic acid export membrane protein